MTLSSTLTRYEIDFAYQDPSGVESKNQDNESRQVIIYRNRNVTSIFVGVVPRLNRFDGPLESIEVPSPDAEVYHGRPKHPYVPTEHVVRVDADPGKVPYGIEPELDLDLIRMRAPAPPSHPLESASSGVVDVQAEVGMSGAFVRQLSEAVRQMTVYLESVVEEIGKVKVVSPCIALSHVIRHETVYCRNDTDTVELSNNFTFKLTCSNSPVQIHLFAFTYSILHV